MTLLFLCAFFCLILETLGAHLGERKIGSRYYAIPIAILGIVSVQAPFYLKLIGLMSIILATKVPYADAYALILATYAVLIQLCKATNLFNFTIFSTFFYMLSIGLCFFRKNNRLVSEISIKLIFSSLFYFCFLSLVILIALQTTHSIEFSILIHDSKSLLITSLLWISWLIWLGAVPFGNTYVDYLDAAPAFASFLFFSGILSTGGTLISQFTRVDLNPKLFFLLSIFSICSLCISAILALDQKRIARMVAYLITSQTGIVILLALFVPQLLPIFYIYMAIVIPGILSGIRFWKQAQHLDQTWEDYSGVGRKHPLISIIWLSLLSFLAGAPGTLGFWLYFKIAQAGLEWISIFIVMSIVLSMVPIVRLSIFMFGKPIRYELIKEHRPQQGFFICFCFVSLLLFWSFVLFNPKWFYVN